MIEIISSFKAHSLFLDHIVRMTDHVGIWEHCIATVPDKTQGYSVDDNARALQLMTRLSPVFPDAELLAYEYLQFIVSARDLKGFHNDMNQNQTWMDNAAVNEGFGRSMAALGEATNFSVNGIPVTSAFVFDQMAHLVHQASSLRTKAQLIAGFASRIGFAQNHPEKNELLKQRKALAQKKGEPFSDNIDCKAVVAGFADDLYISYTKNKDHQWLWYEDILVYDNARLPLGLFTAYEVTGKKQYKKVAEDSLKFLVEATFDTAKDCFSFPGNDGWYVKNGEHAKFGQQPIDAGATVEACVKAYEISKDNFFKEMAVVAFDWYNGKNISGISLIDNESQGIFDGLESYGINPNEGSESILSYLLAKSALDKIK